MPALSRIRGNSEVILNSHEARYGFVRVPEWFMRDVNVRSEMSDRVPPINPYEPPSENSSPSLLAADTEFLFDDQWVAGIGTMVLPKICVVTGEKHDLVPRVSRLSWSSRWFVIPRNLLLFFSCTTALPTLIEYFSSGAPRAGTTAVPSAISPVVAAAVMAGAVLMLAMSLYFRPTVEVHWYLSRRLFERHKRWGAVFLTLCGGMAAAVAGSSQASDLGWMVAPVAIGACVAVIMFRGSRNVYAVGQHEGLVLVGGLSDPFLREVRQMVADYEVRNSAKS